MNKKKHNSAHQYERFETKKGKVLYKCMIPLCNHFLSAPELVINRASLCWGECGREVIITKDIFQDKIKKPFCSNCKAERKLMREMVAKIQVRAD